MQILSCGAFVTRMCFAGTTTEATKKTTLSQTCFTTDGQKILELPPYARPLYHRVLQAAKTGKSGQANQRKNPPHNSPNRRKNSRPVRRQDSMHRRSRSTAAATDEESEADHSDIGISGMVRILRTAVQSIVGTTILCPYPLHYLALEGHLLNS